VAFLAAVWSILSLFLVGVLVMLLVSGERSAAVLLLVPAAWLVMTGGVWVVGRRRLRRS
jgi:hypothetical protein